jgi:hypothetical protein
VRQGDDAPGAGRHRVAEELAVLEVEAGQDLLP